MARAAADILGDLAGQLQAWVGGTRFSRIINGRSGAPQAQDIFALVQALGPASTEDQFGELSDLILALDAARPFRSRVKLAQLQLAIYCGRRCAKHLAEASVASTQLFDESKAIGFDERLIVDRAFVSSAVGANHRIAYFHLGDYDEGKVADEVDRAGTAAAFHILSGLLPFAEQLPQTVVVVDRALQVPRMRIRAFAQAAAIAAGRPIHDPRPYSGTGVVRAHFNADVTSALEQFDDVLQALSESFAETDLLNRFLRLYQVLENFMVRRQVIHVQNSAGADQFSLRDFRRLYDYLDKNEAKSLGELVEKAMQIATPINGRPLARVVADRWNDTVHAHPKQPVIADALFMIAGGFPENTASYNTHTALGWLNNAQQRHTLLAKTIYLFRNIIVHNKSTEFHLTHMSITEGIELFLNNFLIPTVEDLVFSLLLVDRTIVWYQQPALRLYRTSA